jgi:uncharacterized delta-60 repeat protein
MPRSRRFPVALLVLTVLAAVWMSRIGERTPALAPSAVARLSALPDAAPGGSPAPAWDQDPDPDLAAFAAWARTLVADAPPALDDAALAEGIRLARARRDTLRSWIRTDPGRALAAALPVRLRAALPPEILVEVEERVSGRGELALLAAYPPPGRTVPAPVFRHATVAGKEYRAYPEPRRRRLPTRSDISLHGIAIDGELAVSDSPVRLLEPGEPLANRPRERSCPGCSRDAVAEPVWFEAGGKLHPACDAAHLRTAEARLLAAEEGAREALAGNNLPGASGVVGRPAKDWTHGTKRLLVILVDFPDKTGRPVNPFDGSAPVTTAYALAAVNDPGGVRDFYEENSFGKTTLSFSAGDVTAVLRMPQTASHYATGNRVSQLHQDARNAAQTAGFDVPSYDRIGVVFSDLGDLPNSQFTFGGLGSIESKNFWVNGWYAFELLAHELGHTYGLPHANLWEVTDANPISLAGSSLAYGDPWDLMGGGSTPDRHFSPWNKSLLHWIPDAAVFLAESSGTVRLHRFDHASASPSTPLALKIVRDRDRDYWIGHRRATSNSGLDNGAYVLWAGNENLDANLLDLSAPVNEPQQAALAVGSAHADPAAGINLLPLQRGGAGEADEWLDVQVTLQPRIFWSRPTWNVDEQQGTVTLTVERAANAQGLVTVAYATSNGTAAAPADYQTSSGVLIWPAGDLAAKSIVLNLQPDAFAEGSETFTVTLSSPSGAVIVDDPVARVVIADPGARDPDFAPDFLNSTVEDVVLEPDGGLVVAGWFSLAQDAAFGLHDRPGLARFRPDGSFDPTFAPGAGATGGDIPRLHAVVRLPDGKFLVGGEFTSMHGTPRNRIARLQADGTLDDAFVPSTGANDVVRAILALPDGSILVGGDFTAFAGQPREYLARLLPDGTLDPAYVGPDFGDTSGWSVASLALQPDGKLLVGGAFYFTGGSTRAGLCRLLADGSLDPAFTGVAAGAHELGNPSQLAIVRDIKLQPDGRILLAGTFSAFNGTSRGGVARLHADGSLDTAFAPTSNGDGATVFLQPDGKVLFGGSFTTVNGSPASRLARLTAAGALDPTFSAASGPSSEVNVLALQPDGKLVYAGDVSNFQGVSTRALGRLFPGLTSLPGTVQFAADRVPGTEGSSAALSVSRIGGTGGSLVLGYATRPGTATPGSDFTAISGILEWPAGDASPRTIEVPVLADAALDPGDTFSVHLGQPTRDGTLLGPTQRATVEIAQPLTYAVWSAAAFSPAELLDPDISGSGHDPDGDGLTNLEEYAQGLPPKDGSRIGTPVAAVVRIGATPYLTLSFRRWIASDDLLYEVQSAPAPGGPWTTDAVSYGQPQPNGDGTETVTYRDLQPADAASRRCLRLRVSLTPP